MGLRVRHRILAFRRVGRQPDRGLVGRRRHLRRRRFRRPARGHPRLVAPGLLYANLAVRGRQIADVIDEQLPQALAMEPDLVTVCIGMNDVTRPGGVRRRTGRPGGDLRAAGRLRRHRGDDHVSRRRPDAAGRPLHRGADPADQCRDPRAAHRHGFALVDLYTAPSMTEAQTWSFDRMHASSRGHVLFAEAAAEALGLPGSSNAWTVPVGMAGVPARSPGVTRRCSGRGACSSHGCGDTHVAAPPGDGLQPKYPVLQPVSPLVHQARHGAQPRAGGEM